MLNSLFYFRIMTLVRHVAKNSDQGTPAINPIFYSVMKTNPVGSRIINFDLSGQDERQVRNVTYLNKNELIRSWRQ